MGTARKDGKIVTAGGRVLMIVGRGSDLPEARMDALEGVKLVECATLFNRTDIGHQAVEIEK